MEKDKKTKKTKGEVNSSHKNGSSKNIFIILGIVLLLALVIAYIYKVDKNKKLETYQTSYLVSTGTVSLEIKNIEEVNQVLAESPTEYFVLITYTENEDTYKLETGLKTIIDKYKLSDSFYYFNAKDMINEDNYITRLNSAFNTDKIEKIPVILYYKDGKIIDTVKRYDNNIINASDFQHTLDMYYGE